MPGAIIRDYGSCLCSCGATIELDKFYKLKEPLTLPFFRVIFMGIFVKKQGGGLTPPGKFQIPNHLAFEVIWWALQSGQVSLKSVRWHVSPLPGTERKNR